MASEMVVAVTANFIPDTLDFAESNTRPVPSASFRAVSKIMASYLPSAR